MADSLETNTDASGRDDELEYVGGTTRYTAKVHGVVIQICVQAPTHETIKVQVLYLGIEPIQCLFYTLSRTDL